MWLLQLNQWRQQSCTAYGRKARQNGQGIWLYNVGIRQGSSDFFSFSDDYQIFALGDSKPSELIEPLQRIPDLSLLGLTRRFSAAPAAAGPRIPSRYTATLLSEVSNKRADFSQRVWQESCGRAACLGHAHTEPVRSPRQNARQSMSFALPRPLTVTAFIKASPLPHFSSLSKAWRMKHRSYRAEQLGFNDLSN